MTEHPARQAGGEDITVDVLDHAVTVRPTGEIDLERASVLALALAEALSHASPSRPLVVDCEGLTFCDSSGLNAFLSARRTAEKTGTVIRLASPNQQFRRLLEMTGTTALFSVEPDPADRLSADGASAD
ncbi:STAS domain-containing protein [Streptomyces subrutilus]|uniref:STAS domain-containing protein n=1 Tax=Streptomyces subrutilus TaxID=36818 RepID=UPI0033EE261F